jgi:hypothetical protein
VRQVAIDLKHVIGERAQRKVALRDDHRDRRAAARRARQPSSVRSC